MQTTGKHALAVFGMVVLFAAACAAREDELQRKLLARIEALELKGLEQATLVQTQAEAIKQIEKKLIVQNVKILEQEEKIKNYEQRIVELEEKSAQVSTNERNGYDDSITRIQSVQPVKMDHIMKRAKKRVRRLALNDDSSVAFHAIIRNATEVSHIGINQKIVFPDVNINLGGGYHGLSGVFIAPRAGLYLFSTSITSHINEHDQIVVGIVKNGDHLAGVLAQGESGEQDQGSVTIVTQLAAGDEVWVSLAETADTSLWGGMLSSFMGCLFISE